MTGAAVLFTNNHNRTIELSNGRNIVSVTLRRSTRNTPVTITIHGFSYTIPATNYAERLVDAVPVSGHLRESPWKRQPVPVSSLRSKCKEIEAEQRKKHLSYLLHRGAIDSALLAAEAYASSMGPVFQQYNKYRWESTYRAASLGGFSIGPPVNTAIPTITQHWYDPGSPSEVIDIDVWENY